MGVVVSRHHPWSAAASFKDERLQCASHVGLVRQHQHQAWLYAGPAQARTTTTKATTKNNKRVTSVNNNNNNINIIINCVGNKFY
jgi:hypothetical protein